MLFKKNLQEKTPFDILLENKNYDDFKKNIPVMQYEKIFPYIDKMLHGERDVLWPGFISNFFCNSPPEASHVRFSQTAGGTDHTQYVHGTLFSGRCSSAP